MAHLLYHQQWLFSRALGDFAVPVSLRRGLPGKGGAVADLPNSAVAYSLAL